MTAVQGREDESWEEDGECGGREKWKVRERWAGGFQGYAEVRGQRAGFQLEHPDRLGGIGRAEWEFHMQDDAHLPSASGPIPFHRWSK